MNVPFFFFFFLFPFEIHFRRNPASEVGLESKSRPRGGSAFLTCYAAKHEPLVRNAG